MRCPTFALARLVLDPRFNGPPSTANGGYACGAFGELVDGPAEVSLLSPPPLGVPLGIQFPPDGGVRSSPTARRSPARGRSTRSTSSRRCGPRSPMRARPRGAIPATGATRCSPTATSAARAATTGSASTSARCAATPTSTPPSSSPTPRCPNRDGVVAPDIVWAALDCPSYTPALWDPERPSLLARLAVERLDCVEVGEPVIAVGWHLATEGRKHHTASALLYRDGACSRAPARCGSRCAEHSTLT